VTLHLLGKDPKSQNGGSPTIFFDDERDAYVLQGFKILDAERLSQIDVPEHETLIEFPKRMMQFFPEVTHDA
jgi:hypothetical protein